MLDAGCAALLECETDSRHSSLGINVFLRHKLSPLVKEKCHQVALYSVGEGRLCSISFAMNLCIEVVPHDLDVLIFVVCKLTSRLFSTTT